MGAHKFSSSFSNEPRRYRSFFETMTSKFVLHMLYVDTDLEYYWIDNANWTSFSYSKGSTKSSRNNPYRTFMEKSVVRNLCSNEMQTTALLPRPYWLPSINLLQSSGERPYQIPTIPAILFCRRRCACLHRVVIRSYCLGDAGVQSWSSSLTF